MKRITQLCLAHIHREHRLILFPLRLWRQGFLMNQEGVFRASSVFHSPSPISFQRKNLHFSFSPQVNQCQKLIWIEPRCFSVCFARLLRLEHRNAPTHFIISFVCPATPTFVWFDICERTEAINAVAGNGTCSGSGLNNWTSTFPLQFDEHFFRLRDDRH